MSHLADDPAFGLATALATRPGFDCLFDPNPATGLIEAYHDPVGYPTQGFGRLLSRRAWAPLDAYPPIDAGTAESWLAQDMLKSARAVWRLCPVSLEPHQIAALYDFTFNCGAGNLQCSRLRQCVLRGDHDGAAEQFGRWVFAGGVKLAGLVRRRAAEAALYCGEV